MISDSVKNFIDKYKLKEPFIVAFSGGYDSMCLLDVLNRLGYQTVAVHLNHNWRGKESDSEEENCKNYAKKHNIPFYSEILPKNIEQTETAAREARYEFFERCAVKFDSNVVFTAHNYDDNAETVLYRIIKGTGTLGLQGIKENRGVFYRPLLSVKRLDIEQYCKENGLKPNCDSSNENVKYKRNLIRKKIIPLLEEINPSVKKALNSLADIAKSDAELLENFAKENINYRIRNLLIENNLDYDRKKIEEIKFFIENNIDSKSGKKMSLSSEAWLFVNQDGFKIIKKQAKNNTQIIIKKEGKYLFDNYIFTIKKCLNVPKSFPKDAEFKAYINIDKIDFTLRYRKNGDIIHPFGCSGTQKIKKYLNEKKIPNHEKDKIPMLCNGEEVLWVAGYGISDKIKVINKPTHIIELRGNNEQY